MRNPTVRLIGIALGLPLLVAGAAWAQSVTTPPNGGNQKASVSQWLGLVEVNITYNSPDVTAPNGDDRRGKIWGHLVPFGMSNLGFGTCGDDCPWRGGANENTVFTVSHDVLIEGQPLAAGSYGLHMIPGEEEWTLIFSNNSASWGSFFYRESEDALRVEVKPEKSSYNHWLTYEFTDRQLDQATVALRWEDLQVPWTISVPDINGLYVATLRNEMRNANGFNWQGWNNAAQYCLQNGVNTEEALTWAQQAVSLPFIGQENFTTLGTLAQAQAANGLEDEAENTLQRAVSHPTATVAQVHQLGRQLIGMGKPQTALRVFEANAKNHPDTWPVNVGLARGHSALGNYDQAQEYVRKALENVPEGDSVNRQNLESALTMLAEGKDIN